MIIINLIRRLQDSESTADWNWCWQHGFVETTIIIIFYEIIAIIIIELYQNYTLFKLDGFFTENQFSN